MKKVIFLLLLALFVGTFFGCKEDKEDIDSLAIDTNGLSLYWDHEVFGEEGRRYRFEFSTKKELEDAYELVFQRSISGNTITVRLVNAINKGKCPVFPGWGPGCTSRGEFYISEKELPPGTYTFDVITPDFRESARLMVTSEKAVLDLGAAKKISTAITEVFPIPRQILFGSIVYAGSGHSQDARDLIAYLSSLGVAATTLPDYPYRHLSVGQASHLMSKDWPEDNHMISLLYSMNRNFRNVIQDLQTYYTKTDKNLSVYLYTSSGDEARFNVSETVIVYGAD